MICNACGQNEASIHLTEILNNQMVEVHLCETCAEQKGTDFKTHFDFNKLLASLTDLSSAIKTGSSAKLVCSSCRLTYEEFGRTGRLGCANCYKSFERALSPLIRRLQRGTQHAGKVPAKISGDVKSGVELRGLHERLNLNVSRENFEEAAKIRDQIHQLEQKMKKPARKPREPRKKKDT